MENQILFSKNTFSKMKEVANFKSKEYSKYKKEKKSLKNLFFNQTGDNIKFYHFFRNILQVCSMVSKFNQALIIGINPKKTIYSKILGINSVLEICILGNRNFLKRISLVLIKGEDDIWQFEFVKMTKKNKIFTRSILLFGTSIWIFDIPQFLPQFIYITKPFLKIGLANLFQWKMCLGKNLIVTGDISGKITLLNIRKNLRIIQFYHNNELKIPIGDLKLIRFNKSPTKLLLVGGYDGNLKIWSIYKKITLLKEIQFNKRWLIHIDSKLVEENFILIFVNFENGFNCIISFKNRIKIIKSYSSQGSSRLIFFQPSYILSSGNDGYLNFFDINSPNSKPSNYLSLLESSLSFFKWGMKPKINNTIAQSIGVRYQTNCINFKKSSKNIAEILISGFNGIIILINLKKNKL